MRTDGIVAPDRATSHASEEETEARAEVLTMDELPKPLQVGSGCRCRFGQVRRNGIADALHTFLESGSWDRWDDRFTRWLDSW